MWTALSNKSSAGPIQPGTTTAMSGGINVLNLPGGAGCNSVDGQGAYDSVLWSVPNAKWACAWDTGRAAVLQQPVTNTTLVARGALKLGEHQVYAEFTGARVDSAKTFSANQISSSTSTTSVFSNLAYPSTGASYNSVFNQMVAVFPTIEANRGQPIAFRWRCLPCGSREIDTESETGRLLVGAEGPLPWLKDWDYRTGISSASSSATSVLGNGYFFGKEFAATINSGLLNPFLMPGQAQTPAAMTALAAASANGVTLYGGKFTLVQADATATGPLFKLPAGDVMAAVGIDLRKEEYRFNGNATDLVTQARVFNAPFDSINTLDVVKRDIKAVFGEVLVPFTKQFEGTLAVRHDDYTGFGGTTNPKISLRYTPVEQFLVRASANTGFRVPTFNQLFNGVTESPYSGKDLVDPAKCPGGKVDATAACQAINPSTLTGGKADLGPEESKQGQIGFVWAPTANFSIGADWWNINKTGTIQLLSLTDLVNNYNLFSQNFIRDASGNVVYIDQRWVNAGETVTKGVDVNASANGKLGEAKWGVNLDGTYLIEKKSRLTANAPFGASEVATFTRAGDLGLRWKHALTGTYQRGDWVGTLTQLYRSGYTDAMLPGVANGTIVPPDWNANVASYQLWNASIGYTGVKNMTLVFGIKNLFNTDPPFSAAYDSNTGAGSSWEPRVADPRGRSFT
jgi:iron complex outermembrane receptor protein